MYSDFYVALCHALDFASLKSSKKYCYYFRVFFALCSYNGFFLYLNSHNPTRNIHIQLRTTYT